MWRPKGTSDTLDASSTFEGAMASLQNLIPDPTTSRLWQCRPASSRLTEFSTFTTPGFISVAKIIGDFLYGMVASGRNAAHDEPFCYNLATNAFVVVGGVINATTTPASPATAGEWTPPTMDVIGARMVVTHPGFSGAAGVFFGWFDITNPAAPVWNAGNLTGAIVFTTVPSCVRQFNGRAYYIHNSTAQPSVIFSDALNAVNVTNANQALTFGDNALLTTIGQLPLENQLGGIIQGLMVFKNSTNIFQITGDSATSNLTVNALNVATGTGSPNTVVPTPKGVAFMAPDGLRIIDWNAHVSDPIGLDGQGVAVPFIQAVSPSRMISACNGNVLRISVQNGIAPGTPFQEFWYDFGRSTWSGPHTFPAAAFIAQYKTTFIEAPQGVLASLWQSDWKQNSTSQFVENSATMTFVFQTPQLPDTDEIVQHAMTEATLDMAFGSAGLSSVQVSALNANSAIIDTVALSQTTTATIWGAFTWGAAVWGGTANNLQTYPINWTKPVEFSKLMLNVTGISAQGVKLGALHMRYLSLGQLPVPVAA